MKLKSSQGEVFEVDEDVACMSQLVKNMVEDSGADEEIPLPNVKTAILGKVQPTLATCRSIRESKDSLRWSVENPDQWPPKGEKQACL